MILLFIKYYKNHLNLFILDMVSASLMALLDLIFPYMASYIIYKVIPGGNSKLLFTVIVLLFVMYIFRLLLSFIVNYWGHLMGTRIEFDMRRDLFKKVQTLNFDYYDENKTGQIMSRLVGDLRNISEMSHHVPEDVFISLLMIVGSFIVLLTIHVKLTLIIFTLVLMLILFTFLRRKKMYNSFREVRKKHADINSTVENSIGGIRLTKSFTNEDFEINKFNDSNHDYRESWREAYKQMAIFSSGNTFIIDIINISILGVGGYFAIKNIDNFSHDVLLTYLLYISMLVTPIKRLINSIQMIQTGWAGYERFYEIIKINPKINSEDSKKSLDNPIGDIEFKNVFFYYNHKEKHILNDFNISIKNGKKVAIVGETGVGKSTISQLIPRFYDVIEGEILFDGNNIKDYDLHSLRKVIGHVQQDVYIFWGTIKDNILYGNPDASEEEIIEAAKKARIHDFIMSLENGYETLVGERGVKLSGGQKQRISIARVFLKNPRVLILDEATSSLDTITEAYIQEALDELTRGRTTIVIAHRLSTIRNADEIIVLSRNGIIERGTHEQLLLNKKYYAKLYNFN